MILRYYDQFADLFCPELYPRIHFLLPEMESLHETKNGKIGSYLQSLRASMTQLLLSLERAKPFSGLLSGS